MPVDQPLETQLERARRVLTGIGEQHLSEWLFRHGPLRCAGIEFRPALIQFQEPDGGLGTALHEGRTFQATVRLAVHWGVGTHSIPVHLPWPDEFDRFAWGGRCRVFVRQFRFASGPHFRFDRKDAKVIRGHVSIRPLYGPFLHFCVNRDDDSRHARVGKPLNAITVRKRACFISSEAEFWDRYHTAVESVLSSTRRRQPGSPIYYLSSLGQLRTNRFLGLPDEKGSDARLVRTQIGRLFRWDGESTGKLPIEPRHQANYRVRDYRDFLFEQTSALVAHLRLRCVSIEQEMKKGDSGDSYAADVIARKLLSQEVMSWFVWAARSETQFQILDDLNPLTARAHTRRLTFMGTGGPAETNQDSLPEHGDHKSDLGRVCPVDTPQGPRIGLSLFLTTGAAINDDGLITSRLRKRDGTFEHLDVLQQADTAIQVGHELSTTAVTCLVTDENGQMEYRPAEPTHLLQAGDIVSECTAEIPFLQHDDNNRALLGTNFLKQAIALPGSGRPWVSCARIEDILQPSVPAGWPEPDLAPFVTSHGTLYPQCGPSDWSLGRDVWIAVMPWLGWSFEDGLVVSQGLVDSGLFTHKEVRLFSLNLSSLKHELPPKGVRESEKMGPGGVIKEGVRVGPRDVLALFGRRNSRGDIDVQRFVAPYWIHGRVKAVRVLHRSDGYRLVDGIDTRVLVWIEEEWPLEVGDKLASRHGGKGVVCRIEETRHMPEFQVGDQTVRAQVIVNPFGILGRKNLGQLAEAACGLLPHPASVKLFGAPSPREVAALRERAPRPSPVSR